MRQYPCSTHGSKYRRLDGGGRESTCLFVCFVYCFSLSCFAMLRVLAFVSLPCVFVWLVELLTADHTISLSFNRYILLVCLFDKIFANGVSYRCSVEITWPCERTSNPKYHGHCGRRCERYRTSVFHLLLLWHCCSQTKAVVVVHGELSSCDVLHIASKFSLYLCSEHRISCRK